MSRFHTLALLAGALMFFGFVAACGGGGDKDGAKATATVAGPTEAAEPTETRDGAPSGRAAPFDSFHYTVDLGFTVTEPGKAEETFISGQVEGDFVAPDSHAFSSSFAFGGLSGTQEVVIIGNDAWIKEAGGDWRRATRADSAVADAIDLTSADPDFLQDPEIGDALSALDSEPETINGVDTLRYHIPKSALPALTSLLGEDFLQDVSGLKEFEMTVWLEEETGALVRADLAASATPELLGQDAPFDISPDATLSVTMLIDLTQINDSSISIEPPI